MYSDPFFSRSLACLLALLALCVSACSPSRTTIELASPESEQRENQRLWEGVAAQTCGIEQGNSLPEGLSAFTTDGCSMWPDGEWRRCCIRHDIHYWCANKGISRKAADEALRACVREHSGPVNAFAMYWGTRVGGAGWLPFPWRWGYGYEWLEIPEE